MDASASFWKMAGESLRIEYLSGAVTRLSGEHSTGWRSLPAIATAQVPQGRFEIQLAGGKREVLKTPQCVCIPPGTRHCITMTSGKAISRWSHINVFFLGTLNFADLVDLPLIISGAAAKRIGDLNEELAGLHGRCISLRNAIGRQTAGLQLLRELAMVSRLQEHSLKVLQQAQRLAPAFEYMQRNVSEPITQEALARELHLSPSRFRAVFKSAMGVSPRDFLLDLRIQHAQRMLIRTDSSVQAVAVHSGFEDPFHFSRIFRKRCGVSPSAYRKRTQRSPL